MSKSESKPEKHAEHQHFDEIVTTTQKIGPFHHVILLKNDDLRIFELPKNLEPIKYDLMIRYIEKTFDGELKIKIKVLEATNIITLNSEELTIRNVTIDINQLEYLHIHQNYIEIVLIEELVKDSEFEIIINYSGNIRNDSRGFYNSSYFDEKNELKIALATQMEPNSARLVVPCFDEPIYKAIWKLTIIHSNETKAFSNAELEDQEDDDGSSGQIVSKFQDSPKMSSYLLAFVISDFACISKNTTKNAIKIRVCSKPEEKDNLNLALDTAIKILDNFETTFGVPYPLGKLDMIEVKEFRSGAMENWGLIIYKEGKLSYNEEMNNLEDKRMIQTVIAHEIAHQWFGNLVTMKNWNQLWLNEGFATLYQLYGADIANSGAYKWDTQFLLNSQKSAFDFEFESLRKPEKFKNHPVSFKLGENDNIREFFDRITYRKAGSILLMIRKVIGTSVFDKAIRSYLNSSQFENVDEDILFKHFQDAYDIEIPGKSWDLAAFAKSWTENVMFPVVRVEEFNETHLEIKQMKLSYDMKTKRKLLTPITNQSWEIPIFYRKDQEENVEFLWLKKNPIIINASQIILNIDSDCYYRVDYNESIWNLISEQLNEDETVYSVKTRFRLLEDAMFFKKHLEIDDYLKNEKEKLPILAYLKKKEKNWKVFDKHRKFRKGWQFIEDNYNKENEKIDQVETTYQIIEIECRFKNCLPDAQKYIDQMKKCAPNVQISKCSKVPGQFRRLVYCIGKAYDEEFRNLVEEWKKVERRASEIRYFNSIKNCQPKTEKSR